MEVKRFLTNINTHEISLVKTPAVEDAEVILLKNEPNEHGEVVLNTVNQILKTDNRSAIQYLAVPDIPDRVGDVIRLEDVKEMTKILQKNVFEGKVRLGEEHTDFNKSMGYIEYCLCDETGDIAKAIGIPNEKIIKGGLLTSIYLSDYSLTKLKKGEFNGISMGARAKIQPVKKSEDEIDIIDKTIDTTIKSDKRIAAMFKKFLEAINIFKVLSGDSKNFTDEDIINISASMFKDFTDSRIELNISDNVYKKEEEEDIMTTEKEEVTKSVTNENVEKKAEDKVEDKKVTNDISKDLQSSDVIKNLTNKIEELENKYVNLEKGQTDLNTKITEEIEKSNKTVEEKTGEINKNMIDNFNKLTNLLEQITSGKVVKTATVENEIEDVKKNKPIFRALYEREGA